MKMRAVIEAGRKSSPLIGEGLAGMRAKLDSFGMLLSDLASVKSESGRDAMLEECRKSLVSLSDSLAYATSVWTRFSSVLGNYKYQFGRRKKGPPPDSPGQQVMDLDNCDRKSA